MKKKIKNITFEEARKICDKYLICSNCELVKVCGYATGVPFSMRREHVFEEEIIIKGDKWWKEFI